MSALVATLEQLGADPERLRLFDQDGPGTLAYATLTCPRPGDPLVWGVYEWQGAPLIYLVAGEGLSGDGVSRARRVVALRGDAPYLGVVEPGRLVVYRVGLDRREPAQAEIRDLPPGPALIPTLGCSRPGAGHRDDRWISGVILQLFGDAVKRLTEGGLAHLDALSLAGRALFARFLGDRGLLSDGLGAGGDLFDDAARAAATSAWLDETFNGDFLPLSPRVFSGLAAAGLMVLGDIARRAPGGQLQLGWDRQWADLHFAYIPVGVLSQAYERHLSRYHSEKQRKDGGFYTPRPLAELVARAAFGALGEGAARARVLDPAAGAGVFLLTAFRHLVAARWAADGARPDTAALREILYGQLRGFDVNESALRFAALGLYLQSIELDANPTPVEKLRFDNLRGRVLFNLEEQAGGSLGDGVGAEHLGRYDLVIGNPPWSSATRDEGYPVVRARVAWIAQDRLGKGAETPLPNEVMDLPFVWNAMAWARPGGRVAFLLHARLLFQQGDGMPEARAALLRALDVTGIVNGAELRHTAVWPSVSAPWCALFARNELPGPGSGFRFVSPRLEDGLNGAGALRIDAHSAPVVTADEVVGQPVLFKLLFRGGALDREIYERLSGRGLVPLDGYWRGRFGESRGRLRQAGNGYQRLRDSTSTAEDASALVGLPEIQPGDLPVQIDASALPTFDQRRLHRRRDLAIYRGPLLLVHKSPPAGCGRVRVAVCDEDVVFSTSIYGYSAAGHPDGRRLVRYLALALGSRPALWFILVTSGSFGFEREVVEKFMLESIPVAPFESLTGQDALAVDQLFEAVARDDAAWARVDEWVARLWGLSARDLSVIEDTLRFNLPFAGGRAAAQAPSTPKQRAAFCAALAAELAPWGPRMGAGRIAAEAIEVAGPWRMVRVSGGDRPSSAPGGALAALRAADALAATELVVPDKAGGGLWLARLDQARYWSGSQARLVARRIAWEHLDALGGGR